MRWLINSLLIFFLLPSVLAISMNCPDSAEVGEQFTIYVSHTGASKVRLFYHNSWHEKTGSSASWSLSETQPRDEFYYGDAYVNGGWISTGSDNCVVTIIESSDQSGSITFSVSPSIIELGNSVTLSSSYSDPDGADEVRFVLGTDTIIGSKTSCFGTSCSYSLSYTPSSTGTLSFRAEGYDSQRNPTVSLGKSITVTGPSIPSVNEPDVVPEDPFVGDLVSISVSASDSGKDLSTIKVFFGDGTSQTKSCFSTPSSCTKTFQKSYSSSNTYSVYAVATDRNGNSKQSSSVAVDVSSASDSDSDGIPDETDQCPSTPQGSGSVVTSGSYLGCSCLQIEEFSSNPTDDGNACTDDSCSIVNGVFVAVNSPMADGDQPEGYVDTCIENNFYEYFCSSGQVSYTFSENDDRCVDCSPQFSQSCWNGDPYWYDSCGNREPSPIVTCAVGEDCVQSGASAYCAVPNSCTNPSVEVCDLIDNDCDDLVDEGDNLCGAGRACVSGVCMCALSCGADGVCTEACSTTASCSPDPDCGCTLPCGGGDFVCEYACSTNPSCDPDPDCSDADGDGFSASVDCNDNNPNIYPQAPEVCGDGIDQNCNDIDDPLYYFDQDGDGYGVSSNSGCFSALSSPAPLPGDCNDAVVGVNPGVAELCANGVDDNCDGVVDESSCTTLACGDSFCIAEPEVTYEWRRVTNSCVDEQWKVTTSFINPSCVNNVCEYSEVVSSVSTGALRSSGNGLSCSDDAIAGFCSGGSCLVACDSHAETPGCQLSKPSGAVAVSGRACPLSGGSAQVCYKCPENMFWDGSSCIDKGFSIRGFDDVWVTSGSPAVFNPQVIDYKGALVTARFKYRGLSSYDGSDSLTLRSNKVGSHDLSVTAYRVVANVQETLATRTIEVTLTCPADVACCPVGEPRYSPAGSACSLDGSDGVCSSSGECVVACRDRTFENSAAACSDGKDNDCDGLIDCVKGPNGAFESDCRAFCSAFCPADQVACDGSCVDLDRDNTHCGVCGNACNANQVCEAGSCVTYDNCFVACNDNSECNKGGVCVDAGTCDAFCKDVPLLELDAEEQEALLTSVIRQRTFAIKKSLSGDVLTVDFTNVVGSPLENFSALITIPKEVLSSASLLSSNYPFEIVHDDPVIRVSFPEVSSRESVEYYFPEVVDPNYLESIVIEGSHAVVDLTKAQTLSNDDLTITREFIEDGSGTQVRLKLKPGSTLTNLRVPLEIPKCLAISMSEIDFEQQNYEVINDDPLMVWTFDSLSAEQEISFSIPKTVSQDCKDQLRAFGLATTKDPVSPWIPLAIIPVLGLLLIFFQRFHDAGAQKHLSKSEFYALAREQGQSDEEIDREWHEYKRRF